MEGKTAELEKDLKHKMQAASDKLHFEEAARYRDSLRSIDYLKEQQKAITESGDQDAIGLYQDDTGICMQVFFIRSGKLLGRDNFFLPKDAGDEPSEIMAGFIKQYYGEGVFIPREILLSVAPSEEERLLLEKWFTAKVKRKVELLVPKRGMGLPKSATVCMNTKRKLLAIPGITKGRSMVLKVCQRLAPILRAASSKDGSICFNSPANTK